MCKLELDRGTEPGQFWSWHRDVTWGISVGWEHPIPIKSKVHSGKRATYNVSLRPTQETGPKTSLEMRLLTIQV